MVLYRRSSESSLNFLGLLKTWPKDSGYRFCDHSRDPLFYFSLAANQ